MADRTAGSEHGSGAGSTSWRVQSVDRAALLLRAIADGADGDTATTTLAEACGINRATAWRLLSTLQAHRLVDRHSGTGQWSVGPGVAELAGLGHEDVLRRQARPHLVQLCRAARETAALAVLGPTALTYVDEVAPDAIVAATWQGRDVPLHATSTGKAVLAAEGGPSVEDLGPTLERYTDTTVVDLEALRREVEEARRTGYTVCRGEYERSAWGVSSAVEAPGQGIGVLSLWGPASRVTESRFAELGERVAVAARALSRELG